MSSIAMCCLLILYIFFIIKIAKIIAAHRHPQFEAEAQQFIKPFTPGRGKTYIELAVYFSILIFLLKYSWIMIL